MPKPKKKAAEPRNLKHSISRQLRELIGSRGLTSYALAAESGVNKTVIMRFVSGERDLRLATADKIAAALKLRLVEVATSKGKARA